MAQTAWAVFPPRGNFFLMTVRRTRVHAIREAVSIRGGREICRALQEKAKQGCIWPTEGSHPLNEMEKAAWDTLRKQGCTVRKVWIEELRDDK